jgi:hypothetical protein
MKIISTSLLRLFIILVVLLQLEPTLAQRQQRQLGKVYYSTITINQSLTERNDSIAKLINDYILKHAPRSFPSVWLYISDQREHSLSDLEYVQVYYQEHKAQLFDPLTAFTGIDGEHIGISLVLEDNHYKNCIIAIRYAVDHFKTLKKKLKKALKRHRRGTNTDEDLDYSYLFRRNI